MERKRLGFLPNFVHNRLIYSVLSVCALDYTLYLWHVLAHKVPFLWRFHVVHDIDLDRAITFDGVNSVPARECTLALVIRTQARSMGGNTTPTGPAGLLCGTGSRNHSP